MKELLKAEERAALRALRKAIIAANQLDTSFEALEQLLDEKQDPTGWINDAIYVWQGTAEDRLERLLGHLRKERP